MHPEWHLSGTPHPTPERERCRMTNADTSGFGSRVLGGMAQYSVHGSAAQYGREWRVPVRGRNVNWRVESSSGEQRREPVNPKR